MSQYKKQRIVTLTAAFIYALLTGLVVYFKNYDAGDQALVPMFLSITGLFFFISIMLVIALYNRIKKLVELSRAWLQDSLFVFLIYIAVMIMMAVIAG